MEASVILAEDAEFSDVPRPSQGALAKSPSNSAVKEQLEKKPSTFKSVAFSLDADDAKREEPRKVAEPAKVEAAKEAPPTTSKHEEKSSAPVRVIRNLFRRWTKKERPCVEADDSIVIRVVQPKNTLTPGQSGRMKLRAAMHRRRAQWLNAEMFGMPPPLDLVTGKPCEARKRPKGLRHTKSEYADGMWEIALAGVGALRNIEKAKAEDLAKLEAEEWAKKARMLGSSAGAKALASGTAPALNAEGQTKVKKFLGAPCDCPALKRAPRVTKFNLDLWLEVPRQQTFSKLAKTLQKATGLASFWTEKLALRSHRDTWPPMFRFNHDNGKPLAPNPDNLPIESIIERLHGRALGFHHEKDYKGVTRRFSVVVILAKENKPDGFHDDFVMLFNWPRTDNVDLFHPAAEPRVIDNFTAEQEARKKQQKRALGGQVVSTFEALKLAGPSSSIDVQLALAGLGQPERRAHAANLPSMYWNYYQRRKKEEEEAKLRRQEEERVGNAAQQQKQFSFD